MIHKANHSELHYKGGQEPIIHLQADLHSTIQWAKNNNLRWSFTLSNAGSAFFEDRCDITQLTELDWNAINAVHWRQCKEGKQAEFLIEHQFPWSLVETIGVHNRDILQQVTQCLQGYTHKPSVSIQRNWYY